MTAGQDLSCVKGPRWDLYDFVTTIKKGEIVTLLARAPSEWGDYYYIRTSNGTECWAFGGSSTKNGDTSSLPEKEAPPTPTPTKLASGIVTAVTITFAKSVIHAPTCTFSNTVTVTITTNGPTMVHFLFKKDLNGVEQFTYEHDMNFAAAGAQSSQIDWPSLHTCGTYGYKVIVTSPNSMTAQGSFQVVSP